MANPEIALSTISSLFNVGTNNAATTLKNSALAPSLPATNQALLTANTDGTTSWSPLGLSSVGIDATLTSALSIVPTTGTNYALKAINGGSNAKFLQSNGTWSSPIGTLSRANSSLYVCGVNTTWTTPGSANNYRYGLNTAFWNSAAYNWNNAGITVADSTVSSLSVAGFTLAAGTYQITLSVHGQPSPAWPGNGTAGVVLAFTTTIGNNVSIAYGQGGAVYAPWSGYPNVANTSYRQMSFTFYLDIASSTTYYTYLYCPAANQGIQILGNHNTFVYIEKLV